MKNSRLFRWLMMFGLIPMFHSFAEGDGGETEEEKKAREEGEAADAKKEEERLKGLTTEELLRENATLRRENGERRVAGKKANDEAAKVAEAARLKLEEEAKKNGEFETLYTTEKGKNEKFESDATAANETLSKYLDKENAGLTEDQKKHIPAGTTAFQLDWLITAKAAGMFGKPGAPDLKLGGEGDEKVDTSKMSSAEKIRLGMEQNKKTQNQT